MLIFAGIIFSSLLRKFRFIKTRLRLRHWIVLLHNSWNHALNLTQVKISPQRHLLDFKVRILHRFIQLCDWSLSAYRLFRSYLRLEFRGGPQILQNTRLSFCLERPLDFFFCFKNFCEFPYLLGFLFLYFWSHWLFKDWLKGCSRRDWFIKLFF